MFKRKKEKLRNCKWLVKIVKNNFFRKKLDIEDYVVYSFTFLKRLVGIDVETDSVCV